MISIGREPPPADCSQPVGVNFSFRFCYNNFMLITWLAIIISFVLLVGAVVFVVQAFWSDRQNNKEDNDLN